MKKPQTPLHALAVLIKQSGSQRIAADKIGIKPQYLSDILSGRRGISENVAKELGFEKLTVFKPLTNGKKG